MAAAILMMNMHGAVCASSRDRTIFRYSEKDSFCNNGRSDIRVKVG